MFTKFQRPNKSLAIDIMDICNLMDGTPVSNTSLTFLCPISIFLPFNKGKIIVVYGVLGSQIHGQHYKNAFVKKKSEFLEVRGKRSKEGLRS